MLKGNYFPTAPSEPPHNVQVQATAPGELLVKWQVNILL